MSSFEKCSFESFYKRYLKLNIGKHAYSLHFSLSSYKYIFIKVIFPNVIRYLDRIFKEEQNDVNFKIL